MIVASLLEGVDGPFILAAISASGSIWGSYEEGCGDEVRYAGFIVRWNWATEYPSSSDISELVSLMSPRQKLINLGGSGIS